MKLTGSALVICALFGLGFAVYNVEVVRNYEDPAGSRTTNDIYYPYQHCDDNGCSAIAAGEVFPGVIFMPGSFIPKENYTLIAEKIASAGYVVGINSGLYFGPFVGPFSLPITATFTKAALLATANVTKVSQDFALVGHSLGAVAAFVVASSDGVAKCTYPFQLPPEICLGVGTFGGGLKAVVNFASSLLFQGNSYDLQTIVPVTLIRGAQDVEVSVADQVGTYALLEAPKAYISIDKVSHMGITDSLAGRSIQDQSVAWSTDQIAFVVDQVLKANIRNQTMAKQKLYDDKDLKGNNAIHVIEATVV